jgi:hypothetical protein
MDLISYYKRIREAESKIPDEFPIIVSHATPEGGKAGHMTEATRRLAAKLVVEGAARLAEAGEAQKFRELRAEAKRSADRLADATKVQLTVLPTNELKALRGAAKLKE